MRKRSLVVATLIAALGLAAPAAADTIQFDTNGAGANPPGAVVGVDVFDWAPGNSILIESTATTGVLLYQANLSSLLVGSSTNVYANGAAGAGGFFTAVASFNVTIDPLSGIFSINPGGNLTIYANNAAGDNLAGTGFTSGTAILTGAATADPTNLGFVTTIPGTATQGPNPAIPGCSPNASGSARCLDQFQDNDIGQIYTLFALGSTHVEVQISAVNNAYFTNLFPGQNLSFITTDTSNQLPYTAVDPSAVFFNGQAGYTSVCGPGGVANCINGTGDRIMAQADAASTFTGVANVVPEPATISMLGLGLLVAGAARRRQIRNRKS